jgi:hypothetical protein
MGMSPMEAKRANSLRVMPILGLGRKAVIISRSAPAAVM